MVSPRGDTPQAVHDSMMDAKAQLLAYAASLAGRKRRSPEADLASRLLLGEVTLADGSTHRLSDTEFELFLFLLIFGGNETTRSAVSAGILAFSEHPDQWARLLADRSLVPTAVEEILRYTSPVASMRRTVTGPVTLRGVDLDHGDRVVVWYPAANRDERVFGPTAEAFDVGRAPGDHQAFGAGGPHFCLGAWLARLELRLMLEELLDRLPDLHVAGPPVWARSNLILGPVHLPVAYSPPG
jgi:cholest-4-en-3-one 26-monooxygenase